MALASVSSRKRRFWNLSKIAAVTSSVRLPPTDSLVTVAAFSASYAMISEAASESRSVNSALISIFPPPSGRVNVVGFSVGFSSSIPPLRTVHFRKKKFSAGVAVRVTVSPGMADAGLASAVPLPVVGYGDLARNGGELGFDFDVCGGHRECRRVGRRTFQFGVAAEDRPFREREVFLGVAVRVIVSPAAADAGAALAVPLPSSVTAVVYRFGSFVSSEQETAVSVHTVAA